MSKPVRNDTGLGPEYEKARAAELQGDRVQAYVLYLKLYQNHPSAPNLAFRLGLIAHQSDRLDQARDWYHNELSRFPDFWSCRANLGRLELKAGRWPEAQLALTQALLDCPDSDPNAKADIYLDYSRALRAQNKTAEAIQNLIGSQKIALKPQLKASLARELAQIHRATGNLELSQHYYLEAQTYLDSPHLKQEYAHTLTTFQHYVQAYPIYLELSRSSGYTSSEQAHLLGQAANCLMENNQAESALDLYEQALRIHPAPSLELSRLSVMPLVYTDQYHLLKWRQQFSQNVRDLKLPDFAAAQDAPLNWIGLPFYVPYQGFDDCALLSDLADKVSSALPAITTGRTSRKPGKLRVGGISHFFYQHSVMNCFADLFISLGSEFELQLISLNPLLQDALSAELAQAGTWNQPCGTLLNQVHSIQALELDVLIYTDTLLDPHSYLLSQYRLAPVQVLLPGQPLSSGVANMDYFISDAVTEKPDAQQYFREKLIFLPTMPAAYRTPDLPCKGLKRRALNLPDTGPLYLCAAASYKIHPDMDQSLCALVQQDTKAQLILLQSHPKALIEALKSRLSRSLSAQEQKRVIVLPRQSHAQFQQLLLTVDLLLETWPFGSFNTLMDAFLLGTPVLTFPGPFLRGRYAQSLLQALNCPELIAQSPEEYVFLAQKVAADRVFSDAVRRKIRAEKQHLFSNPQNILHFQTWLRELDAGNLS